MAVLIQQTTLRKKIGLRKETNKDLIKKLMKLKKNISTLLKNEKVKAQKSV